MSVRTNQNPLLVGTNSNSSGNTRIDQADLMLAANARYFGYGNTRVDQAFLMLFMPLPPFIPIPANPNEQAKTNPVVDPHSINSRTAAGFETWYIPNPPEQFAQIPIEQTTQPYVLATGNPVVTRADGALWDIIKGEYVTLDQTSVGTNRTAKNGQ